MAAFCIDISPTDIHLREGLDASQLAPAIGFKAYYY